MNNIPKLKEMLLASHFTVAITGAGISNSCGIADMEKMNVLNAIETSLAPLVQMHPERSYNLLRKSFLNGIFEKGPSLTHRKISTLEKDGLIQGTITTNIDHLHSLAGSTQVAEIQGSYAINKCSQCGHHNDNIEIWNNEHAPRCSKCNGLMLSFPVYSHVGVYEEAMTQAKQWMTKAELVLIIGSKGNYSYYLNNLSPSTSIIQINPQVTQFDNIATLNIKDEADNVFKKL